MKHKTNKSPGAFRQRGQAANPAHPLRWWAWLIMFGPIGGIAAAFLLPKASWWTLDRLDKAIGNWGWVLAVFLLLLFLLEFRRCRHDQDPSGQYQPYYSNRPLAAAVAASVLLGGNLCLNIVATRIETLNSHDPWSVALPILTRLDATARDPAGQPSPPTLTEDDRAILDAAKPSADALLRYWIAVREGDDESADALRASADRRLREHHEEQVFHFALAQGEHQLLKEQYDGAIGHFREALQLRPKDIYARDALARALTYSRAQADYGSGLREAATLLRGVLNDYRHNHATDDLVVSATMHNLALVLVDLGRLPEAEPLLREALGMHERVSGQDQPIDRSYLAWLLSRLGRHQEADALARESLEALRVSNHVDQLKGSYCINNLADIQETLGRYDEAEALYRESLAIVRRIHSDDHPTIATSLNNLAYVLERLERVGEAESLYRESLAMSQRLYQGDHPDLVIPLGNLASLLCGLGQPAEAEVLAREALAMDKRLFGNTHPQILQTLLILARTLSILDQPEEAEVLASEALAMSRQLCDGDHFLIAHCLGILAETLSYLNRPEEASARSCEALVIIQRVFDQDHPVVAGALRNFADMQRMLGREEEAENYYREALLVYKRAGDDDHAAMASGLMDLADVLSSSGRVSEALPLVEQATQIAKSCLPEGHPLREEIALAFSCLSEIGDASPRE